MWALGGLKKKGDFTHFASGFSTLRSMWDNRFRPKLACDAWRSVKWDFYITVSFRPHVHGVWCVTPLVHGAKVHRALWCVTQPKNSSWGSAQIFLPLLGGGLPFSSPSAGLTYIYIQRHQKIQQEIRIPWLPQCWDVAIGQSGAGGCSGMNQIGSDSR